MWSKQSRQSRGYGRAWDIKRLQILRRDKYLCQCRHCKAEGRITPASEVDHIVSKAEAKRLGWSDERTESDSNLQSINHDCHERKNLEDKGVRERVQIGVDGWPVAG
jgi:5-methylcytosine-specific restriction protein A